MFLKILQAISSVTVSNFFLEIKFLGVVQFFCRVLNNISIYVSVSQFFSIQELSWNCAKYIRSISLEVEENAQKYVEYFQTAGILDF